MPYVPKEPHRRLIDPYINGIVRYIDDHASDNGNEFNYAILQYETLRWLALYFYPLFQKTFLLSLRSAQDSTLMDGKYWKSNKTALIFTLPEKEFHLNLMPIIIELGKVITDQIGVEEKTAWVGCLNYISTEILLLSTHGRRYHHMNLLKGICGKVKRRLENFFKDNGNGSHSDQEIILQMQITGVFQDIGDEFCRRIMNNYEDKQIAKLDNGDTRGYLRWLPAEK